MAVTYLFPSIRRFVVAVLLHLALPFAFLLLLVLAGGPVAFAVAAALLAPVPLVLSASLARPLLAALFAGLDVLLEGDHGPLAAVQRAVLALPRRQDGPQAQGSLVGHLLTVGRLLEDGRVLLLRLLNHLLRDVGDEEQQAVANIVLD